MGPIQCYELFQKRPLKQPTWVQTATSLEDARNRLKELSADVSCRVLHSRLREFNLYHSIPVARLRTLSVHRL